LFNHISQKRRTVWLWAMAARYPEKKTSLKAISGAQENFAQWGEAIQQKETGAQEMAVTLNCNLRDHKSCASMTSSCLSQQQRQHSFELGALF
jgi:hypothetical protein